MTASKTLLYFCLSFVGGIFLNSFFSFSQVYFLRIFIFGLFSALTFLFLKRKKLTIFTLCFLLVVLGVWRCKIFALGVENNELKNYFGQEVELIGIVNEQPILGEKISKLKIKVEQIGKEKIFKSKILITRWKYPEYKYGDKLKITGILKEPQIFESSPTSSGSGFDYKEYLAKDGIFATMYSPRVIFLGEGFGSSVMTTLFSVKNALKKSIAKILPVPQAGLLEALLFGDEENIPGHWKEKFNLTGTRHIAAVSGMNITIISFLILNFLLFLGFWRHQAFYISIVLIILYVLAIGAPPPGVRAAIMGILFLTAQHLGRSSSGIRPIVFSATLVLFFNPLLLVSDIGFQLSFLAILGLSYLQNPFFKFLKKVPNVFEIRYSLAATLAAQIFTLPILIYNFGQIPLSGPVANIFIVPLLSFITIFGFILAVAGTISVSLALILSFPAWLLLTYIFKIVEIFSRIPQATILIKNVSPVWLIISYLVLGFIIWRIQKSQKLKFLEPYIKN